MHVDGCAVVLQQLDAAQHGDGVIEVLSERYEVEVLDEAQLFRVMVDDARFPDEAVVRLASSLRRLPPKPDLRFFDG